MKNHISKDELLAIPLIESTPRAEAIRKAVIDWLYAELRIVQQHDVNFASNTTQLDVALEEIHRLNKFIWSVKTSKYKKLASFWLQYQESNPRQIYDDYHRTRDLKKEMKTSATRQGSERPDHEVRSQHGSGRTEGAQATV